MKGKASFGDHAGMCCADRNRNIKREAAKSAAESAVCRVCLALVWKTMARWCVCLSECRGAAKGAIAFARPCVLDKLRVKLQTFIIIAKSLQMRLPVPVDEAGSLLDLDVMRAGIGTVGTRISQSRLICNNCSLALIGLGS